MTKRKKFLFKCLIVLFTYLLIELTCFIFIKTGYIPAKLPSFRYVAINDFSMNLVPHPGWGIWHKPGHFVYQDGCIDIDNLYNTYGTRDIVREKKSDDTNRVILLGDSFVEGFGVKEEKRFSSRLEKETGRSMMNFGCNSFGALQSVMMYEQLGRAYDHSTILWGIFPFNDIPDDDREITGSDDTFKPYAIKNDSGYSIKFLGSYTPADSVNKKATGTVKEKTVRLLKAFTCWYNIISYLKLKKQENKKMSNPDTKYPSYYYDYTPEQADRLKFIVNKLRIAAPGKRIIIFAIPVVQDFLRREKEKKEPPLSMELKKICYENNIEYLDLLPQILTAPGSFRQYYFYCDPHWNESGHLLVNDILKKQLNTK